MRGTAERICSRGRGGGRLIPFAASGGEQPVGRSVVKVAAMARKKNRRERRPRPKAPTSSYVGPEGSVLVLRQQLSPGSISKIADEMANAAANVDDIWQRRTELLFERLAVSWEIAGLPLEDQKMLLGRYRMADPETRRWVRDTINGHVLEFIPELGD